MTFFTKPKLKPLFTEILERRILTDDENPTHLLFEGDILEALHYLYDDYYEGVDLIYADPPRVNDSQFRIETNRHFENFHNIFPVRKNRGEQYINWLSFIELRISHAHALLKPSGCFFISATHRDAAHLKLICDNIFSPENYLTTFIIKTRHESHAFVRDADLHEVTEQILFYRKSDVYKPNRLQEEQEDVSNYLYEIQLLTEKPERRVLGGKEVEIYEPHEYIVTKGASDSLKFKKISIRGAICEENGSGRFFERYLKNLPEQMGYLFKVSGMGNDGLGYRYFQTKRSEKFKNGFYFQGKPVKNEIPLPFPNFFDFTKEYEQVHNEGGVSFTRGKKPVGLMKKMLKIGATIENTVILDMFAGSGSLAHAAMELNNTDGLKRKVILCNTNEYRISEKVTFPRLKNVMQGYVLDRIWKEELFSIPLTPRLIRENGSVFNEKFALTCKNQKENYEEIIEVIENQHYIIYGAFSKGSKIAGLGNSLKYFRNRINR
ncbi:site-specific DNA-methyltransferase [Bacteroidales bacterium OttesenSCG-928-B11]|nr:site-specific DNA-methyltransferase [Bacteroidales bacterium OttesenSCG-928-C03]MDL2311835.1 site-specific DNA-methyltransferase [Bacteroidales bacterium OttesenSCG-928-B11]MDL2325515.1 site-specific DNA-methyltransferase [Bacteroidales bacterium OttesenSCG-928-A14]